MELGRLPQTAMFRNAEISARVGHAVGLKKVPT